MGCSGSRFKNHSDEFAIDFAEKGLNIYRLDARSLDEKFRKYSHGEFVNKRQLLAISKKHDIKIANYESHKKIDDFFRKLESEGNGNYKLQTLLILGIFLGQGTNKQKAKLLFEVADHEYTEQISVAVLRELFERMSNIACDLGKLVCDKQTEHSNSTRNEDYIYRTRIAIAPAFDDFKKNILKDGTDTTISKATFVENLVKFEDGTLVSTFGLRVYLKKFEKVAEAKKFANPFRKNTVTQPPKPAEAGKTA
jgi:Ca2+-binding EF-hand superfamily protein